MHPGQHARRSSRLVACVLAGLAAAGCASTAARAQGARPPDPLLGPAATVVLGDDDVTLLRSGPATFARLARLIGAARSTVYVEVYEFNRADLADALIAARRRGVEVIVIDDPSEASSIGTDVRLRNAGIDVIDYPVRKLMIDHVKLMVVDGSAAVVGGINWGSASPANHDYDALVHGPVVHNLDRVFERDLLTCGRLAAVPDAIRDTEITVAATLPAAEIRPLALDLINSARRTLDLELFDLTDVTIVQALESAMRRGVRVRLLLDPGQTSNAPADAALSEAGVSVRWYRTHGELLHAKALVADSTSILFGSANWSGGGFSRNHELDIEIPDSPRLANQMLAQMSLDWVAAGP